MSQLRPVLILKAGTTVPAIAARRGDFEDWIGAALGIPPDRLDVVRVFEGQRPPPPEACVGAVVTGSSAFVSDREPWSEATGEWLAAAVALETPILGICYGHQLLAQALGGRVGVNPRGREIGTVEVEVDAEGDELLGHLGGRRRFQATHVESALELPEAAIVLARNRADPHHAFSVGRRAWGVQFHPEFDADIITGYIEARAEILRSEGLEPSTLLRGAEETPAGHSLLRRFGELVLAEGQ